jgi:hypothetical protein
MFLFIVVVFNDCHLPRIRGLWSIRQFPLYLGRYAWVAKGYCTYEEMADHWNMTVDQAKMDETQSIDCTKVGGFLNISQIREQHPRPVPDIHMPSGPIWMISDRCVDEETIEDVSPYGIKQEDRVLTYVLPS